MLYVLQLLQLRVLWKVWKPGQMILREPSVMLYDKLGECYRIAVTHTDLLHAKEFGDVVVGKAYKLVVADVVCLDGTEGSSGSHSPLTVAVWAYLARVLTFAVRCVRRRWRFGP